MPKILLLDDEAHVLAALSRILKRDWRDEADIETFNDPHLALLRCQEILFDAVISDYRMPGMNGVEFLKMVRKLQPDVTRMALSASTDFSVLMDAINEAHVSRFIAKPWQEMDVCKAVREAVAHTAVAREQRLLASERMEQITPANAEKIERRRLEQLEPGITAVRWGPNGEVLLDD